MPTLLVVDDEPSILHFFRRAFAEPEVTLLTASSAAEGLEAVARDRPDVVVLDINLPDASGLEAFRRIHADRPEDPGHLHHRPRHDRHRHRGDEAGRLRVPAQAAGAGPAVATWSSGPSRSAG